MWNGHTYYAQTDVVGNTVALADTLTSGGVHYTHIGRTYTYDDWGQLVSGVDSDGFNGVDRVRWKGALDLGTEVGIYYMRNRWYDPPTGRFLSEDPAGLTGGVNQYAYAADDPVNNNDPTGKWCQVRFSAEVGDSVLHCEDITGADYATMAEYLASASFGLETISFDWGGSSTYLECPQTPGDDGLTASGLYIHTVTQNGKAIGDGWLELTLWRSKNGYSLSPAEVAALGLIFLDGYDGWLVGPHYQYSGSYSLDVNRTNQRIQGPLNLATVRCDDGSGRGFGVVGVSSQKP